jgi:hypothetical protein
MWLAYEGDVLVTPRPIDDAFKAYACDLLGVEPRAVRTLSPPGEAIEPLANRVRRSDVLAELRAQLEDHPDTEILPFALDAPTLALLAELDAVPAGYCRFPENGLRAALYGGTAGRRLTSSRRRLLRAAAARLRLRTA